MAQKSLLGNTPNYLLGDGGTLSNYQPTLRERGTDFLRGLLFTDDREGQQQAERLSNVLEFTPYGAATAAYDVGRAGGQGDIGTAATMMAMAGLPGPSPKGFKAYHGSPHDFDRFSLDKIGTGEGAQAYGHGLYFADSEGVAKSYRDALAKPTMRYEGTDYGNATDWGADDKARILRDMLKNGKEATLVRLAKEVQHNEQYAPLLAGLQRSRLEWAAEVDPSKIEEADLGSMYEVQINADPDSFLDWDKPLSEQPDVLKSLEPMFGPRAAEFTGQDVVKKASGFDSMVNVARKSGDSAATLLPTIFPDATPEQIAGAIKAAKGTDSGPQIATSMLRDKGIPGIKYLDQGSRTKGDGSRNYVVFDDKLIEIMRKYGIAGLLPLAAMMNTDDAEAAQK